MSKQGHPPEMLPCACSALRQAARAVSRHYEACLAPTGVTTTQYSILRLLEREGATPLKHMADTLEFERTSLYRAIAPLEREGFVSTHVDPEDARVKRARIEQAGLDKIEEVLPVWRDAQASFLSAVGDSGWLAVSERLVELRESIADNPDIRAQL